MIRKHGELEGLEPNEPPVEKGFVRVYEMFNSYEDIPEKEFYQNKNSEFLKILSEEIQKEVNREIIEKITRKERVDNK